MMKSDRCIPIKLCLIPSTEFFYFYFYINIYIHIYHLVQSWKTKVKTCYSKVFPKCDMHTYELRRGLYGILWEVSVPCSLVGKYTHP